MKEKTSNINHFINFIKGIACIFVIIIHCNYNNVYMSILKEIGRFAVPFFVMVSGFFVYCKDNVILEKKCKKALIKISKITLYSSIMFILWNFVKNGFSLKKYFLFVETELLSVQGIINFICFNRALFLGNIMYYLFMMIYVYELFILIKRIHISEKFNIIISIILLFFGFLMQLIFSIEWYYIGNWIFLGLPFFIIGNTIAILNANDKLKVSNRILIALIIIGILISASFPIVFKKELFYDCGTIILSISLIILAVKNPNKLENKIMTKIGKNYSLMIFIIHCVIRDLIEKIFYILKIKYSITEVLIIIVISILSCFIIKTILNFIIKR